MNETLTDLLDLCESHLVVCAGTDEGDLHRFSYWTTRCGQKPVYKIVNGRNVAYCCTAHVAHVSRRVASNKKPMVLNWQNHPVIEKYWAVLVTYAREAGEKG